MRLGGRLAAAIEVLSDMEKRHRPAADALKDWGLSHRFAGAGDRAAIGNIVYDALRRRRSAAWKLGEESPRAAAFGALLLEWNETVATLDQVLEGDRFAPEPFSTAERAAIEANRLEDAPELIQADLPDWCQPFFEASFGEEWVAEAAALADRPPLDLRINRLQSSQTRVQDELKQTGAVPTAIAPSGLRIPPIEGSGRHPNVQVEPAFQKGWFEIQDEGSQIAAHLACATAGMQVLDFCAGAGGKTLALAADMENRGHIFAYDADKSRLAPIFDRLKRAETRNVQAVASLESLSHLENQADLVLIDAPCTGSGTWRRRPDAKWRLSSRQLDIRVAEQAAILDRARSFVKPGGHLAYVTCSVFEEENTRQVEAFLARHPEFTCVDQQALWNDRLGRGDARFSPHGILMSPRKTGTDGFFFASLKRAA